MGVPSLPPPSQGVGCTEADGEVKEDGEQWCGIVGNWVECREGTILVLRRNDCHYLGCLQADGEVKAPGAQWCGRRGKWVECREGTIRVLRNDCDVIHSTAKPTLPTVINWVPTLSPPRRE